MVKLTEGGVEYGQENPYLKRENIKIQSYKHDGKIHRVWSETTILKGTIMLSLVAMIIR